MICQICNKEVTKLGNHLFNSHKNISQQMYYDKYIKKSNEDICPICNKPLSFLNLTLGYAKHKSHNFSICKLCNKEILNNQIKPHIENHHNIKIEDYYNKYLRKNNQEGYCIICNKPTKFINVCSGYEEKCDIHKQSSTYYTCKICNNIFYNNSIKSHLISEHQLTIKDYYDTYLKNPNEGFCIVCGKPTKFLNIANGYPLHCSKVCANRDKNKLNKIKEARKEEFENSKSNKIHKYKLENGIQCAICKEYLLGVQALSNHLSQKHQIKDKKEYFDLYRKGNTGICLTCGKNTKYLDFTRGYEKYCSLHCNPEYQDKSIFKCEICQEEFAWAKDFSKHLKNIHDIQSKDYYDKYLKKDTEGICQLCGKPTKFLDIAKGYLQHCSSYCQHKNPIVNNKIAESTFNHYGVRTAFCLDRVRQHAKEKAWTKEANEKRKKTSKEHYGTEYPLQSKEVKNKIKQTLLEKYGYENPLQVPEIREKIKQTNLERYGEQFGQYGTKTFNKIMLDKYGVEYASQNEEFKNKIKQTNLERYGVVSPLSDSKWMVEATKKKYGISVINQFNNPIDKTLSENDL